jgi:hypothetical protein
MVTKYQNMSKYVHRTLTISGIWNELGTVRLKTLTPEAVHLLHLTVLIEGLVRHEALY